MIDGPGFAEIGFAATCNWTYSAKQRAFSATSSPYTVAISAHCGYG